MNVQQMHLAIQQGVDKINSLQADMLLSEEIDIELNKSQMRFINTKYGKNNKYQKGFEESQKRVDDIRTIVTEYKAPTTYKERYDSNFWVDSFRLPNDYMYLVNQKSDIFINECNLINWTLRDSDPVNYFTLDLDTFVCNNEGGNSTDFVTAIRMAADPDDLSLGAFLLWINLSSFQYPADIEAVRTDILAQGNAISGISVYWEQYGELNYPGQFIVIVDTNIYDWFNWDASVTNSISGSNLQTVMQGGTASGTILTTAYAQYAETAFGNRRDPVSRGNTITKIASPNKFIQHDDITTLLRDPFNTTKHTAPLTTIRGHYIDIYTSDIFIIDAVKITYIRKPKEISLSLGASCELPNHSHQEIVDMTVSSILEGISDPRYKSHQLEVSKNE